MYRAVYNRNEDANLNASDIDEVYWQVVQPVSAVQALVEVFGKAPTRVATPTSSAVGAAIQGAILSGEIKTYCCSMLPASLGIDAWWRNDQTDRANTPYPPARARYSLLLPIIKRRFRLTLKGERPMVATNSLACLRSTGYPAPRGVPQIEVTFDIDANGILNVTAKDKATGKEQHIRIEASSGLTEEEIKRMKEEAAAHAEADRKEKERVDKLNQADAMIFQTEKQLKEIGDKIPADKKGPIEAALNKLKEAHKAQNLEEIDQAINELNTAFHAASQEIYNATSAGAGAGAAGDTQSGPQQGDDSDKGGDDVTDVDFEEVE